MSVSMATWSGRSLGGLRVGPGMQGPIRALDPQAAFDRRQAGGSAPRNGGAGRWPKSTVSFCVGILNWHCLSSTPRELRERGISLETMPYVSGN